jgi:hypothetical protein
LKQQWKLWTVLRKLKEKNYSSLHHEDVSAE